jgi:hypothetical protein
MMILVQKNGHWKRLIAAAFLVFVCTGLNAQESANGQNSEDDVIEEIVVIAGKRSGDPVDVEALYEEMMRERLMLERDQLRVLEEETSWRKSGTTELESPSRIRWGYDPAEEMQMRRESELNNVSFITTKPATLFKVDF